VLSTILKQRRNGKNIQSGCKVIHKLSCSSYSSPVFIFILIYIHLYNSFNHISVPPGKNAKSKIQINSTFAD